MDDQRRTGAVTEPAPATEPVVGHRTWLRAGLAVASVGWGAQQFTPLLLFYQAKLDLGAATVQATFVPYVVGLLPGLLFGGPFSDRFGRRTILVPTMVVSALASVLLILGGSDPTLLFAGRLLGGLASGAGFSAGAAWIRELSANEGPDGAHNGPRRLTVMMGIGFGLGPLVAGLLAQWAPFPTVVPYVPHLLLTALALALVLRTPETARVDASISIAGHLRIEEVRDKRFAALILPFAPWVFIAVSVAVAYLPAVVKTQIAPNASLFSAVVVAANAGAGIAVAPMAKRIAATTRSRLLVVALVAVVIGMLVASCAAAFLSPSLVVVASLVLGAGYGMCQVFGLTAVQLLARPGHLAGVTAAYQAISYVGLIASYPLTAIGSAVTPTVVLIGVAVVAALTLAWTLPRARAQERVVDAGVA